MFSILMIIIVMSQVVVRGLICATKARPLIAQMTVENARTSDNRINLDKFGFQIGFGVRNANDMYERHNPNYVEFLAVFEEKLKGETKSRYHTVNYHKCTKQDYDKFSPVSE